MSDIRLYGTEEEAREAWNKRYEEMRIIFNRLSIKAELSDIVLLNVKLQDIIHQIKCFESMVEQVNKEEV